MIAKVRTAALLGIEALPVSLQVDLTRSGMSAFTLVGLAEGALHQADQAMYKAKRLGRNRTATPATDEAEEA